MVKIQATDGLPVPIVPSCKKTICGLAAISEQVSTFIPKKGSLLAAILVFGAMMGFLNWVRKGASVFDPGRAARISAAASEIERDLATNRAKFNLVDAAARLDSFRDEFPLVVSSCYAGDLMEKSRIGFNQASGGAATDERLLTVNVKEDPWPVNQQTFRQISVSLRRSSKFGV